jgi:mannitol/fructose-specific phosphotransferase system IIA component (Ntr-type)
MGNLISTTLVERWVTIPLKANDHESVIQEVLEPLQSHPHVKNCDVLYQETWARELKESTCIGNGIAFPHARTDAVDQLVIAAGVHPAGISFAGVQSKIHLVFCIGTPVQMGKEYLTAVGALARLLKEEVLRHRLISSKNAAEFHHHITTAEKQG